MQLSFTYKWQRDIFVIAKDKTIIEFVFRRCLYWNIPHKNASIDVDFVICQPRVPWYWFAWVAISAANFSISENCSTASESSEFRSFVEFAWNQVLNYRLWFDFNLLYLWYIQKRTTIKRRISFLCKGMLYLYFQLPVSSWLFRNQRIVDKTKLSCLNFLGSFLWNYMSDTERKAKS